MKKRNYGFTLIELLAVIVVLAVIVLVATPIILNVTDDSKDSAILRSAEYYLDAVDYSVVRNQGVKDGEYAILTNGNICLEDYDSTTQTCKDKNGDGEVDVLEVKVNKEAPNGGVITFRDSSVVDVLIRLHDREVVKNLSGILVYKEDIICTPVVAQNEIFDVDKAKDLGTKYNCEVKEGTTYTFYVLSNNADGTTNLIMNANICSDGKPASSSNAWSSACRTQYNAKNKGSEGPMIALENLNKVTSSWREELRLNQEYTNEIKGVSFTVTINGKARLPFLSEIVEYNGENAYLFDNLNGNTWHNGAQKDVTVSTNAFGYWTMAAVNVNNARRVTSAGKVIAIDVDADGIGMRPVITVKL